MLDIEFRTRSDDIESAGVPIGGRVIVMSCEEWADFAKDVIDQIQAHLTQRAADGHWSCPRCRNGNKKEELFCGWCGKARRR